MILVKYEQNGLELWVEESTGMTYTNMRTIARLFGLDPNNGTLRRRLEVEPKDRVKRTKIQTSNGLKLLTLYPSSIVFDLAPEFNPELAKAMGVWGANVYS
jgi:hypothetical protein